MEDKNDIKFIVPEGRARFLLSSLAYLTLNLKLCQYEGEIARRSVSDRGRMTRCTQTGIDSIS
jgi:hypothetical protein